MRWWYRLFVIPLLGACTSAAVEDVSPAPDPPSSTIRATTPIPVVEMSVVGPLLPIDLDDIRQLDVLISSRYFDEAAELADAMGQVSEPDPRLEARSKAIAVYQEQLEIGKPWSGTVAHLFTHSLIYYPEDAFDGDRQEPGYQENMLTASEFERILDEMYAGGWILIDIHDAFEQKMDGTIVRALPLIPPGRKPFVLSIDDVSYYDYMATNGFAERLDIDDDLNVATVFRDPGGGETWNLDGDVVPILDQFIWEHPDFSLFGAKGIIALTGYEGILGYDVSRDQVNEPDYSERQEGAQRVADRLHELGWLFASHSYTHHGDMRDRTMSFGRFKFDAENWRAEVGIYVGDTDLYIPPYGYHMSNENGLFRFLIEEEGFNVYCPISDGTTMTFNGDNLVSERRSLDGYALLNYGDELAPYFDAAAVWDKARGPRETGS